MGNLYVMKVVSGAEEYIRIKGEVSDLKLPVLKSEVQYLTTDKIQLQISEEGGLEIPDILYYEGIILVSNRWKIWMDSAKIDYIFWKQADIYNEIFGIYEIFWIMVVPRIDCIDLDESVIDTEWDFADGLLPMLSAEKIKVNEKMVGRFSIFKILGLLDNNIYVTESFVNRIDSMNFEGVEFLKL